MLWALDERISINNINNIDDIDNINNANNINININNINIFSSNAHSVLTSRKVIPCLCPSSPALQGYLAHKKLPPSPRTTIGPWA